jgi:hypothetical protein
MPGTPDEAVDDDMADVDEDPLGLRSLMRMDRKSVRLGLSCHRNGRWYSTEFDEMIETSSESLRNPPLGGIKSVASPSCCL